MDKKRILSIACLLGGEAIIIALFTLLKGETPNDIFALNLVVASLVYCLGFIDILFPMVNFKDASKRTVGSMGIRWVVTLLYGIAAIAVMVICNLVFNVDFKYQLLLQCLILLFLGLGFVGMFHSSDKVTEIHHEEKAVLDRVQEMKSITGKLSMIVSRRQDIPAPFKETVVKLEDDVRYLSPANSSEARSTEAEYIDAVKQLIAALETNTDASSINLSSFMDNIEYLLKTRKNTYSN